MSLTKVVRLLLFSQAHFKTVVTDDIQTAMWNKYIMITGLSGITTLMHSSVGPIQQSPYGKDIYIQFLSELHSIAKAEGMRVYPPEKNYEIAMAMGPAMKASMLRDMEKGLPIEADHLQGEFLNLAVKHNIDTPILKLIYNRLKVYEINLNTTLSTISRHDDLLFWLSTALKTRCFHMNMVLLLPVKFLMHRC